jgi:hypothetical protein
MCVFDGPKPRRKRDIPFQEFSQLSRDGTAWGADPANWNKETGGLFEVSGIKKKKSKQARKYSENYAVRRSRAFDNGGDTDSEAESDYENNAFNEMDFNAMSQLATNLYSTTLLSQVQPARNYRQPSRSSPYRAPPPYSRNGPQRRRDEDEDEDEDELNEDEDEDEDRSSRVRRYVRGQQSNRRNIPVNSDETEDDSDESPQMKRRPQRYE